MKFYLKCFCICSYRIIAFESEFVQCVKHRFFQYSQHILAAKVSPSEWETTIWEQLGEELDHFDALL